jgi:hypothetical protein
VSRWYCCACFNGERHVENRLLVSLLGLESLGRDCHHPFSRLSISTSYAVGFYA